MQETEFDEKAELRGKILVEFTEEFSTEHYPVDQSREEDGISMGPFKYEMLLFPYPSPTNEALRKQSNKWYNKEFVFNAKGLFKLLSVLEKSGVDLGEVRVELPTSGKPLRIRDLENTFHLILCPLTKQETELE